MIKLDARPSAPRAFTQRAGELLVKLKKKVAEGQALTKDDIKRSWSHDDVPRTLRAWHNEKCCYCERKRDPAPESDVEHFRPKLGVTGFPAHPGYWWLSHEWNNFLFSCKRCNQKYKGNHFPLREEEKRVDTPDSDLALEEPFLINPAVENPEDFISYRWDAEVDILVKPYGVDDECRGSKTIEILGLDQPDLMEERGALMLTLRGIEMEMRAGQYRGCKMIIDRAKNRIKAETSSKTPFSGFKRAFFRAQGLREYISD